MTVAAGTEPHKIFLAGRWVESPDVLEIVNPADPSTPAGWTYTATDAQYEEAVVGARAAGEITPTQPSPPSRPPGPCPPSSVAGSCARSAPASAPGARSSDG